MIEALDPEFAQAVIEQKLREIHSDLQSVRCEEGTGQAVIVVGGGDAAGDEMVRAEFRSGSETYRLLKLYEDTCNEGN